jgi:hypothetical protein
MKHFNNDTPLIWEPNAIGADIPAEKEPFEKRVRDFFDYRWKNDRNVLNQTEQDEKILN